MSCQGLRYKDRPKKRQALTEITANQGRDSSRHTLYIVASSTTFTYVKEGVVLTYSAGES